ncbi:MAG: hypothetical protein JRH17_23645 [Deltaproteobacteria bacterium]|nr:hypothetical protein [Deltaproteobacteria bacterium]
MGRDGNSLPSLPTHVGLVFTNAVSPINLTIEAFEGSGTSLGTTSHLGFTAPSPGLVTANATFFGVIDSGGISRLDFSYIGINTTVEFDHFQYGSTTPDVPMIGSVGLTALVGGLVVFGAATRRRRHMRSSTG